MYGSLPPMEGRWQITSMVETLLAIYLLGFIITFLTVLRDDKIMGGGTPIWLWLAITLFWPLSWVMNIIWWILYLFIPHNT